LLKKGRGWTWNQACQQAFDALKSSITEKLLLSLSDVNKPFELHTDASDFAIRGVLMQERHPIAFESRKLSGTTTLQS